MAPEHCNRTKFTKNRIDSFSCPEGKAQAFLWDSGMPGLGLRATRGSKVFVFQARLSGQTIRTTIGPIPPWDIDEARAEAKRLGLLVHKGIDPRVDRAEREQKMQVARQQLSRSSVTFGAAWDAYVAARSSDWSEAHRHDHSQVMTIPGEERRRSKKKTRAGVLFPLRNDRLAELTPERIAAWLEKEKTDRPTVAARGYRLLRACLNWCSEQPEYRGLIDSREILTKNVRRAVPSPKPKDDCLQREQLKPWFEAVGRLSNPVTRAYLQCLLLTGARPQELARLQWTDIDFQWKTMTLRDKVEGDRQIPLTPHVAKLLTDLRGRKPRVPRRHKAVRDDETAAARTPTPKPNPWVFSSSRSESGRMGEANHAHTRAVKDAALPHVTLHGLRRSFGTLAEWVECPVGVVAQIQGHKPSAIAEKHYRRRPIDLLRLWHEKIENWILEEAGLGVPR